MVPLKHRHLPACRGSSQDSRDSRGPEDDIVEPHEVWDPGAGRAAGRAGRPCTPTPALYSQGSPPPPGLLVPSPTPAAVLQEAKEARGLPSFCKEGFLASAFSSL